MTDIIRVLRVIEYIGPRDAVERTIERSIHGTRHYGNITIHAATVAGFPDIEFQKSEEKGDTKEQLTDAK